METAALLVGLMLGGIAAESGASHDYYYQDDVVYYAYWGEHPIPDEWGGGWCYDEGPHTHAYAPPIEWHDLFAVEDGYFVFLGDPTFYDYAGDEYWYYGAHPVDYYSYDVICYIEGPHVHYYPPTIIWATWYYWDGWAYIWYGPWPAHYVPHRRIVLSEYYPNHWAHHHHRYHHMYSHYSDNPPPAQMPSHAAGLATGHPTKAPVFASQEMGDWERDRASNIPAVQDWQPANKPMRPAWDDSGEHGNLPAQPRGSDPAAQRGEAGRTDPAADRGHAGRTDPPADRATPPARHTGTDRRPAADQGDRNAPPAAARGEAHKDTGRPAASEQPRTPDRQAQPRRPADERKDTQADRPAKDKSRPKGKRTGDKSYSDRSQQPRSQPSDNRSGYRKPSSGARQPANRGSYSGSGKSKRGSATPASSRKGGSRPSGGSYRAPAHGSTPASRPSAPSRGGRGR